MRFEGKVISAFVAAQALLGCISVLEYRRIFQQGYEQAEVGQVQTRIEALDAVSTDMLDAETGQRGYIITGDPSYLDPYRNALSRVDRDIRTLRQIQDPDTMLTESLDRLNSLIAKKLGELKSRIDVRDRQGLDAASTAVEQGGGKASMDQIRALVGAIKEEERTSLAKGFHDADVASREMKAVILLGGVLAFVLLLLSGLFVYQEMTRRKLAEQSLRGSEERFRLMISSVKDYAISMLDPKGNVTTWNEGVQRIFGYTAEEIFGRHFSVFYPHDNEPRSGPKNGLEIASEQGRYENEGWRIRKDGSPFWAHVVFTALHDESGQLIGFVTVVRDVSERKKHEQEILLRSAELKAANKELEAFCYSVSHDLRAPLRGIDGFGQALLEDYADRLDDTGKDYLHRIRAASQRMAALIDDLLNLSKITRTEMRRESVDVTELAQGIALELEKLEPGRKVELLITPGLRAQGDKRLVRIALENLLANAWKFTSKREHARIELGRVQQNGSSAFFVRDNGAGFDPAYSARLFGAFQRLHTMTEFPGSGIGLATVQRIVTRHGGKIWAESAVDQGATFFFTL